MLQYINIKKKKMLLLLLLLADDIIFFIGMNKTSKAVPLHAMEMLGWRGGIAPTHS
jgi:hypothetical protein